MTAPTVAVERLLARAAVRSTGLLHIVSRRDTGSLIPVCGANPIRSREIEEYRTLPANIPFCPACAEHVSPWGGVDAYLSDRIGRFLDVPLAQVDAADDHARRTPGAGIEDLVDSVRAQGIVVPLIVRRTASGYTILDGARRLYAATVAGLATIPVIVSDANDNDSILEQLAANLHRADLNPIDQARAYQHALDTIPELKQKKAELGRRLGLSREQISNTIRLLGLPQEEQDRIAAGELSAEGGRKILQKRPTPAPDEQIVELSRQIAELLTVRKVQIKSVAAGKQIVLTVADDDLARVLAQFGVAA